MQTKPKPKPSPITDYRTMSTWVFTDAAMGPKVTAPPGNGK